MQGIVIDEGNYLLHLLISYLVPSTSQKLRG